MKFRKIAVFVMLFVPLVSFVFFVGLDGRRHPGTQENISHTQPQMMREEKAGDLEAFPRAKKKKKTAKIEKKARKAARHILKKEISSKLSKSDKLWKAYEYVVKNTVYFDDNSVKPGSKNWEAKLAYKTLSEKAGDCYGFASAFVYLAREIGYKKAKVCYGSTMSASYPWAPHGWAEIKIQGETYLFDPEIEYKNHTCGKLYKKKYSEVARKYKKEQ